MGGRRKWVPRIGSRPAVDKDSQDLVVAVTKGSVAGALDPVARMFSAVFGAAAAELSEELAAIMRHHKEKRLRKLAALGERTTRMLEAAAIEPTEVPPKVLLPLLEGATLEVED